jgi:putative hemolysin
MKGSLEMDNTDGKVNQLKYHKLFTVPWTWFTVHNHAAGLSYCYKNVHYKAQFELRARCRKMIRAIYV